MGINIDNDMYYGIKYSYDEVKHITNLEDTNENFKDYDLPELLNEILTDHGEWSKSLTFDSSSPYFDCDIQENEYIIGKKIEQDLTFNEFIKSIDVDEIKDEIKIVCQKLKLQYTEPVIFSTYSEW